MDKREFKLNSGGGGSLDTTLEGGGGGMGPAKTIDQRLSDDPMAALAAVMREHDIEVFAINHDGGIKMGLFVGGAVDSGCEVTGPLSMLSCVLITADDIKKGDGIERAD